MTDPVITDAPRRVIDWKLKTAIIKVLIQYRDSPLEVTADAILSLGLPAPAPAPVSSEAHKLTEAEEDQARLVRFFNQPENLALGNEGDANFWSPGQSAIAFIERFRTQYREAIARKAPSSPGAAGLKEGFVLVPKTPTREMYAASGDVVVRLIAAHNGNHDAYADAVWSAMIASAPSPDQPSEEIEN